MSKNSYQLTKGCVHFADSSKEHIWLQGDPNRATLSSIHPVFVYWIYFLEAWVVDLLLAQYNHLFSNSKQGKDWFPCPLFSAEYIIYLLETREGLDPLSLVYWIQDTYWKKGKEWIPCPCLQTTIYLLEKREGVDPLSLVYKTQFTYWKQGKEWIPFPLFAEHNLPTGNKGRSGSLVPCLLNPILVWQKDAEIVFALIKNNKWFVIFWILEPEFE